ncbi:DUF960 family protein [Agrilactobacillus fermenti]|uniref:DUF960 family protein n=1 Tax=Agrilactobacillus fermenti TaxID=2586909 RepID=UPI001E2DAEAC|nr:DUF960 family protein [Agrilactobacillus fermenti]MCD2255473.1 hypothetical protein [Agrilactobacillus fermenti]
MSEPENIVSHAVAYATPHFFIQLLWTYIESLQLENVRPADIQYFSICQKHDLCTIQLDQQTPKVHFKWQIKLINDQLQLPENLVLVNQDQRHILCLPHEVAEYQDFN